MSDFKLTLLRKWELGNEFSFVCASILLPDGTAVILTSDHTDWHKYYALVLSTEGIKKISIEYTPMSNRDYRHHHLGKRGAVSLRYAFVAGNNSDKKRINAKV